MMQAADGRTVRLQGADIVEGDRQPPGLPLWQWRIQTADKHLRNNIWAQSGRLNTAGTLFSDGRNPAAPSGNG
ncbi:hypothetical protein [Neisseria leonii]|uniref:hypothetical protein n=1 Tax=Neisseria leonii TaxID=2995413 RepID=UPI00237B79AE|nr:hypothetical protein [Neisseria sp. 3986]MDD9326422.1 hypothetical protein [Neisseria sp. 3986]